MRQQLHPAAPRERSSLKTPDRSLRIPEQQDASGIQLSLSLIFGEVLSRSTLAFALTRGAAGAEHGRVVWYPHPLGERTFSRLVAWLGMFTDAATAESLAGAAREQWPSLF